MAFLKGTKILTAAGEVPVENITPDMRISTDSLDAHVITVDIVETDILTKVTFSGKVILYCTPFQEFFNMSSEQYFARALVPNMIMVGRQRPLIVRDSFTFHNNGQIASKNNCTWAAVVGGVNSLASVYSLRFESPTVVIANGAYCR